MPTTVPAPLLACTLAALLMQASAPTQEAPPSKPPGQPPAADAPTQKPLAAEAPHIVVRQYPRDKNVPIAAVGEHPLTLGDLVDHLDENHHPGFRAALASPDHPEIQRYLQSDLIAAWVRQFADIQALKFAAKDRTIDEVKLRAAQSDQLKQGFQRWLDKYIADRKAGGASTDLTQNRINSLLADYQLRNGLAAEMQGWLDYLEPENYTRAQLFEFFNANARAFGGQVRFAHILVPHRDAGTGILLADEGLGRATARLADIRARLLPDGSNFEEVARLCSEDTRTAPEGGMVGLARRFDDRLPAVLCRAAWDLQDGQVSDVIESQYGWHLIKRLEFQQQIFILFTDDAIPSIKIVARRSRQEDWLWKAREHAKLKLLL